MELKRTINGYMDAIRKADGNGSPENHATPLETVRRFLCETNFGPAAEGNAEAGPHGTYRATP
jgi:hypothetical protein